MLELNIAGLTGNGQKIEHLLLSWTIVTEREQLAATLRGIGGSQAMIEFNMDGTILTANKNFLSALGYEMSEIQGKHHGLFVDSEYKASPEYQEFWAALGRGEFQAGEFRRIHKNGGDVWIQAAYNPVNGFDGKPYKVVKNAVDITAKKIEAAKLANNVKDVTGIVASASTEMQNTAQSLSATAEQTTQQAAAVAAAAEQASANVQTVASAAEELSASVEELAVAAEKIGEVVNLISDIAAQTNLLALNATIEAARAGDAGKGFAVVANEVKSLASQTAKATGDISAQISSIQNATGNAVKAIKGIGGTINKINEIATAIASAVEEQGAATQEIARNVQEAASGTQEVTSNIAEVQKAAAETGEASSQVLQAAAELSKQAEALQAEIEAFMKEED